jgi:BlaI family transcriptional regulator, penicillinase repressor
MVRPKSAYPTERELSILKILWRQSPLGVREVREELAAAGQELAHTTVITTLNVMTRKKYLHRTMHGNACLFSPRIGREEVSRGILGDIVNRVFDGSAKEVALSLFNGEELSATDLNELRKLIDRKAKENKNVRA